MGGFGFGADVSVFRRRFFGWASTSSSSSVSLVSSLELN
jgi:hypothetical protein